MTLLERLWPIKFKLENRSRRSWIPTGRIALLWGEQREFQRRGVALDLNACDRGLGHRVMLKLIVGPGAGYKRGHTAFVAFGCRKPNDAPGVTVSLPYVRGVTAKCPYHREKIMAGFTQNSNAVPCPY